MAIWHIPDFREGKQTRRGRPTPTEPFAVVAVTPNAVDEAIGARSERERREFLRRQRALGRMVCQPGRLTQRVRLADGRHLRCYVFRGEAVPRLRATSGRVTCW